MHTGYHVRAWDKLCPIHVQTCHSMFVSECIIIIREVV